MKNKEVDTINKYLETNYGRYLNGSPIFRIIWSDDMFENRWGHYEIYSGPIYLRTEECVKLVHKYNYIKERWILEKFSPPPISITKELPDSVHGSFEPLYIFESAKGIALKPILPVCQILIQAVLNPWERTKKNALIEDLVKQVEEKDEQMFKDMIENESNIFLHRLHHGEIILNSKETL